MRQFAFLLSLTFLMLLGSGCTSMTAQDRENALHALPPIQGSTLELTITELKTMEDILDDTLKSFGWASMRRQLSSTQLRMTGLTPDDREILLSITTHETSSSLTIRVGYYGNPADELRFLETFAQLARNAK